MRNEERLILWLIETRDPKLYRHIQSVPLKSVAGDLKLQAKTLFEEYEMELNDTDLDRDLLYKCGRTGNGNKV